jgi:1,4-alpha-glucan branching enzyme
MWIWRRSPLPEHNAGLAPLCCARLPKVLPLSTHMSARNTVGIFYCSFPLRILFESAHTNFLGHVVEIVTKGLFKDYTGIMTTLMDALKTMREEFRNSGAIDTQLCVHRILTNIENIREYHTKHSKYIPISRLILSKTTR